MNGMPDRFIIEHDTRGTLQDQEWNPYGPNNYLDWSSRFSPTKLRSEAMVLIGREAAALAVSRLDPKIRRKCVVRRYGSWSAAPFAGTRMG